jgi:hypothetical protein
MGAMTDALARASRAPSRTPAGPVARAVGWLSAVSALGAALLSIGHLGVDVPLVSALGPGGDGVVPVAATIFAVGALLYAVVAWGAFAAARWAWTAGVAVNALALLGGVREYRGTASAVALALALAALVLLLLPAGRRELRGQDASLDSVLEKPPGV